MARKLLMNSGLMPVQDGLICWLDGRDVKNGDTTWKDRSGNGNDFALTGNFNCVNGMFDNLGVGYATLNKRIAFNEYTIEIGFITTVNENISLLFNARQRDVSYKTIVGYISASNWQCYSNTIPGAISVDLGNFPVNSNNFVNFVVKNNSREVHSKGGLLLKDTSVNSEYTSDIIELLIYRGKIASSSLYTVKIYNRPLNEAEIQQNYLYEKSIQRG